MLNVSGHSTRSMACVCGVQTRIITCLHVHALTVGMALPRSYVESACRKP